MAGEDIGSEDPRLLGYMLEVSKSAEKFSNYMQATAVMFDMNTDEMGMAISLMLHAAVLNMIGDESDEDITKTLYYIDAVTDSLAKSKDLILREHVKNRKG